MRLTHGSAPFNYRFTSTSEIGFEGPKRWPAAACATSRPHPVACGTGMDSVRNGIFFSLAMAVLESVRHAAMEGSCERFCGPRGGGGQRAPSPWSAP